MRTLSDARHRYAELVRSSAQIRSERLVRALSEVPREDFLGPGPWKSMRHTFPLKYEDTPDANPAHIYDDVLVALDFARGLNNGLPSALARWIDATDIAPGERVVHAGCGTGYYTALIAHMVGSDGCVIAIEYDPDLAARARVNLREFPQAEVIAGDATTYDPGPADAIFVNAGATHPLPLWLDSLKPNGRLVFPIVRWPDGASFGESTAGWGVMIRIQRMQSGYSAQWLSPCGFYPCFGAVDAEADRRLAEAFAQNGLTEVHSLRREAHERQTACLLHGEGYCFSRN
ncbi:MAG TPA: methyltransferase domain-containing protein [Candidatus Binataceae bacterium]|nr:methyltransferase domain-containing protein [Candidatus Binataceae bacterium]